MPCSQSRRFSKKGIWLMTFRTLLLLATTLVVVNGPTYAQRPTASRMHQTRDLTAMADRVHLLTPEERVDLEKQLSLKVLRAYRQGQAIEYRVWSRALKKMRAARGAPVDLPRKHVPAYYQSYQPNHFNFVSKFGRRKPTINLNRRRTEGYGGWIK